MMFRSGPRFGMRISCASKEVQPFLSPLQTTSPNPFGTMVFPVDTTIPQRIQPSTAEGLLGFCLPFRCYDTATCGIEPGWSYLEHFGALTFRASCVGLNASDVECFLGGKLLSRRGLAEEEASTGTTPDELSNGLLLGVLGSSTNLRA